MRSGYKVDSGTETVDPGSVLPRVLYLTFLVTLGTLVKVGCKNGISGHL